MCGIVGVLMAEGNPAVQTLYDALLALQHRGLVDAEAFALDDDGMADMVSEYASALAATFVTGKFDIIGASFGTVLASHVWHAAKMAKGCPQRLVCIVRELQEPGRQISPLCHGDTNTC